MQIDDEELNKELYRLNYNYGQLFFMFYDLDEAIASDDKDFLARVEKRKKMFEFARYCIDEAIDAAEKILKQPKETPNA